MKVLSIGADRSKRGIHVRGSAAYERQKAYAKALGSLDIIGYTLRSDGFSVIDDGPLRIYPTNASTKLLYGTIALVKALRLPKPDVVTAQDPAECGLLALWIARIRGVPLHIQMHTDMLSDAYAAHSWSNRLRRIVARYVLARASGIRVVAHRILRQLVASSLKLVATPAVLPIYVDVERYRTAVEDAALAVRFAAFRTKLLVVARLEPEKNVALALRAFKESAQPSTCLIIVGRGSEEARLKALAAELDIAESVFFEGEREASPYYTIADLVLVTSHFEGYGLVIIEALASGKPVLSTDVGVADEVGAIIASDATYGLELAKWFSNGSRTAELRGYPYRSFEDYVAEYVAHIRDTVAGI
jgi:glycosyltransferase involved in cell wall biosynthesis